MRGIFAVLVSIAMAMCVSDVRGATMYRVTDLGTLGAGSWAGDVNDALEVTGGSTVDVNDYTSMRPFRWSAGAGIQAIDTGAWSQPNSINDNGII